MDKKQQILLRRLGRAYGKSARIYFEYASTPREYLAGYPVYMREADFLEELERVDCQDGVTMGAMASLLGITQGAATQIAARLVKKGFITKFRSKEDRRCIQVTLTQLGKQIALAHRAYEDHMYEELLFPMFENTTEEEIRLLIYYEEMVGRIFQKEEQYAPLAAGAAKILDHDT